MVDDAAYAKAGGAFHELANKFRDGQPWGEIAMDNHNNQIGRELGKRAIEENWPRYKLAEEVMKAINERRTKPTFN